MFYGKLAKEKIRGADVAALIKDDVPSLNRSMSLDVLGSDVIDDGNGNAEVFFFRSATEYFSSCGYWIIL